MAHILLIDDEPQILRLYGNFLEMEGHAVVTAPNGKVGMRLLTENRFDVVVTDIIMPEKDGLELLMSQMNTQGRPKVIAITGGAPSIDQEQLMKMAKLLKADLVLPKPLKSLKLLVEAIQTVLGSDSPTPA